MLVLEDIDHILAVVHTEMAAVGRIRAGRWHVAAVGKVQHLARSPSTTCHLQYSHYSEDGQRSLTRT